MSSIRIARILSPLTALGPGRRIGLWVQGCTLACPACASRDTWNLNGGATATVADLAADIADRFHADPTLTGLTLTGGEPVQQPDATADLIRLTRQLTRDRTPAVDTLLFTGYRLPAARRRAPQLLALIDAVITGRYQPAAGHGGHLRGSANQQLHLLTELGEQRHQPPTPPLPAGQATPEAANQPSSDSPPSLQVAMNGTNLYLIGIPRPGDLDRLRDRLAGAGITLGQVSWKP